MILALVLQRSVKGEQQAAVLVLAVRHIVDMCLYLLLGEGAAPDGKVVD